MLTGSYDMISLLKELSLKHYLNIKLFLTGKYNTDQNPFQRTQKTLEIKLNSK